MTDATLERQLQADCDSLREILAGLERLEREWDDARATVRARQRGYFTPDEDDRVRQMLLAYRNYRLALYEIINRYLGYETLGDARCRLRGLIIGFAAALTLYAKSLKLIQAYEHEPLVRKKLNEPDAKFGLEADFFEEILGAYTSLRNHRLIAHANQFWRAQRKTIKDLRLAESPEWEWLCQVIRRQRADVRKRFGKILRGRLRYDWRVLWQATLQPVRDMRYTLRSFVGSTLAKVRTTTHYQPAIDDGLLARLHELLRPGDVLLVRAEQKITTAVLPGFWAHAALYLGSRGDLAKLELDHWPRVRKHWNELSEDGGRFGQVLEAINPRVLINSLEECLYADHVAVLRPAISRTHLAEAIDEAFGHVGKAYDFEFDFNTTSRIVCTELIYRSYHRRAGIEFPLVKRLGRFTLTCDDIMNFFLDRWGRQTDAAPPPFQLVALVLKGPDGRARFIPPASAVAAFRAIRSGQRPTKRLDLEAST
ncbi:MAG: YiiX/YebB-like N1pC/P60 family cysteine hydrolase [Limisphaerales bacterium]